VKLSQVLWSGGPPGPADWSGHPLSWVWRWARSGQCTSSPTPS